MYTQTVQSKYIQSHVPTHSPPCANHDLFVYKMTGVQFAKKSKFTERGAHEAFQRSNGPRGMSGADLQVFTQLQV